VVGQPRFAGFLVVVAGEGAVGVGGGDEEVVEAEAVAAAPEPGVGDLVGVEASVRPVAWKESWKVYSHSPNTLCGGWWPRSMMLRAPAVMIGMSGKAVRGCGRLLEGVLGDVALHGSRLPARIRVWGFAGLRCPQNSP